MMILWVIFAYLSLSHHKPEALNIRLLQHIQVIVEVIHWELIHHLIEIITPRDGQCMVQDIKDFHGIGGHELVELYDAHLLIRPYLPMNPTFECRSQCFNTPENCSFLGIIHGLHYLNCDIIQKE